MPKRILVKAPGRVVVSGRQYQFGNDEVGKTLLLPDHEAKAILDGVSKHNFALIASEPEGKAVSIHQLNVTAVVKPTKKLTPITKHTEWATPYAPGTTPDPIYYQESKPVTKEEPKDEQLVSPEPVVEPVVEPVQSLEESTEESSFDLDPKAHWSKVKAVLADMEEKGEYDYELVKKIQELYPSYDVIQKECERILENTDLV
jgi:predicted component of type VI protein secretion system